jgi:hypothetical protein
LRFPSTIGIPCSSIVNPSAHGLTIAEQGLLISEVGKARPRTPWQVEPFLPIALNNRIKE